jgi:hypothetical protein
MVIAWTSAAAVGEGLFWWELTIPDLNLIKQGKQAVTFRKYSSNSLLVYRRRHQRRRPGLGRDRQRRQLQLVSGGAQHYLCQPGTRDIMAGSCGPNQGYLAGLGWDFCTGLGSPLGKGGK